MEKKKSEAKPKAASLRLQTETLRRLDDSQLQGVVIGGGRLRVPGGYADDTTPIYDDDTTSG